MTDQELDELDLLTAKKVMGWYYTATQILALNEYPEAKDNICWCDSHESPNSWHPTRNIEQAWELLEKLDDVIKLIRVPETDGDWLCKIKREICHGPTYSEKIFQSIEGSAPLAIVKACLAAVGASK